MTTTERERRRPRRLRRAAWQLAFSFAVLGLLELALRLFGVVPPARESDPFVGFAGDAPFFELAEDGSTRRTAKARARHLNPQSFVTPKPPGVRRVICLGGSTTYGRPYADPTSFAGWLREALPEAAPGERWEVLNAGAISYASYRVARVQAELLQTAEPDLFILYTGHNEFLEARTFGESLREPSTLRQLSAWFSRTALFGLVQRGVGIEVGGGPRHETLLGDEVAPLLDAAVGLEAYTRDDDSARGVLEHFRTSLTRMLDAAAARDVPVLLVAPASQLVGCAPFKSDASDPARDAARLYAEGMTLLGEARDAEQLARAGELLRRARDEDIVPLRAPSRFVQSVRDLAATRDVWWLDGEAVLAARAQRLSGAPLSGPESFLDHVHMMPEAYGELAFAMLDALAAEGFLELSPSFDADARAVISQRVLAQLEVEDHVRALTRLAAVLDWAGKRAEAEALTLRAQALGNGGSAFANWQEGHFARERGELARAAAAYLRATQLDPGYTEAHFNLAEVLLALGDFEAALVHADASLALDPQLTEARFARGIALGKLGRREAEREAYGRVLDADPEHGGAWTRLGLSLLAEERGEEALQIFERGRRLAPDEAALAYNHGVLLALRGEIDRAREAYLAALAADPDYARAQQALSRLASPDGGR